VLPAKRGRDMEVPLALLADYANVTQEGKLNIMGIFGGILAPSFPTVHLAMRLVMNFEAGPAEKGTSKRIEVKLLDQDGGVRLGLSADILVPNEPLPLTVSINQIIEINHLQFNSPGDYSFDILINGETKKRLPFSVEQLPPAVQQAK
ncbi:MAG: hypothetical protein Q8P59_11685, partial [Dehalococcoidia bacterium]|nr:hypothetical protein [Dehalococcoidia bacterium]